MPDKPRRGASSESGPQGLRRFLTQLYEGDSRRSHHFRAGLLIFDCATLLFVVLTSFVTYSRFLIWTDFVLGLVILADFLARLFVSRRRLADLASPTTWADVAAIVSFLLPLADEGAGFLRVLRTLRLLRTYHVLMRFRGRSRFFRHNEEAIIALANLAVFLFVMTGIVYETQHRQNPEISNYVDALYFTVTALTTTGFGDITLGGTGGRLIAVVIMIFGVTLFLRLVQVILRPRKIRFTCPSCGLQRHEVDAVHCKACGELLNIPDEGRF
ncbi:voltage-gated potassium channel [Rhodopseudomonas julia]|uniref:Voltage-gated potassium channel n=1 Tax=Rhodopseudomonas julia TaxID=200617 RepID=A0ABU0C982_9BRAD|nr:voltage-gated potassium channel [Rhodopseudomonas julia]